MIVMKFGGTSVADAAAIRRLTDAVRRAAPEQPLVVVSALSGTTDALLRLEAVAVEGRADDLREALAALESRHHQVARDLEIDATALRDLPAVFAGLAALLARAGTAPWSAALRDEIVAHGELLSSRLVTAALRAHELPAVWFDARTVIRTDHRFGAAIPDSVAIADLAELLLVPLLGGGALIVTQGFIGSTADGRGTTLGRGGSDFTAALLGAALKTSRVEIWTDVDGLMSADPRLVPEARLLTHATYDEAAELSAFGAKVLHPATQLPLADAAIPIVIRNTFAPEKPGTRVVEDAPVSGDLPIRSIAFKRGATIIRIRAARMLGAFGFLRRIFQVFEEHEIVVDVLASSEVSVSLTVDWSPRLDAAVADLRTIGEVSVQPGYGIVSIVGRGLRGTPGICARAFSAIADVNIEMTSQGASASNLTFLVLEEEGPGVVRALHRAFFPGAGMKILIVGTGRMAHEVAATATAAGDEVVAMIGAAENPGGAALTPERLAGIDAVIEFTTPAAVVPNLHALAGAGATVVCGTTGWDAERPEIEALFRSGSGALLAASNFSLGVHLMHRAVRLLAAGAAEWPHCDAFIHERHHAAKKDLPSGTAIALRESARAADPSRDYPITSVRAGNIPGEHEVVFEAPFESVTLRHVARDRRVFASGALTAARWLVGRQGVYTVDALFTPD